MREFEEEKMKLLSTLLLVCFVFLSANTFAGVNLIASEDFEGGAAGWSDNSTDNTYPTTFTEFLGRFGAATAEPVWKTFPITGGHTRVSIAFDFYEIDSWDYELFKVFVNGQLISSHDFKHNRDESPLHGLPRILPGDTDGNQNIGFTSWPDQGYRYEFELDMSAETLTLGFETTIMSLLADESYGIDNLVITQEVPDPVPFAKLSWIFIILAMTVMGFVALRRRSL